MTDQDYKVMSDNVYWQAGEWVSWVLCCTAAEHHTVNDKAMLAGDKLTLKVSDKYEAQSTYSWWRLDPRKTDVRLYKEARVVVQVPAEQAMLGPVPESKETPS